MFVVSVLVNVLPNCREAFISATCKNAEETRKEAGNIRFDILSAQEDPNQFMLYEVYSNDTGLSTHKETPHYILWRDTVASMMASPRCSYKYNSEYPTTEREWK